MAIPQSSDDRDKYTKAATIVTYSRPTEHCSCPPDGHVGSFGKDSIEMRRDDNVRPRGRSGTLTEDVADSIDSNVAEFKTLEALAHQRTTGCFLEGGGRHLAEANAIVQRQRFAGFRRVQGGSDSRDIEQIGRGGGTLRT